MLLRGYYRDTYVCQLLTEQLLYLPLQSSGVAVCKPQNYVTSYCSCQPVGVNVVLGSMQHHSGQTRINCTSALGGSHASDKLGRITQTY